MDSLKRLPPGVYRVLHGQHELASACTFRKTFLFRFLGLMGRRALPASQALLLLPCSSVHMLFMRFPIDAVLLDSAGTVLRVSTLRPWTGLAAHPRAYAVLELPAGAAADLQPGATLQFLPRPQPQPRQCLSAPGER